MTGSWADSGDVHGNGPAESEHGRAYLYLKKGFFDYCCCSVVPHL